ncbi:hypothetical protein ACF8Q9_22335 [Pseudomonas sp. TYF_15]|jgi:hypothetical protein|uniref:Prophage PSSB64-02 n=4 Tax=Pseudomonas TaxID=286 RepID=A0AAX0VRM5_9PSED|nr:MULTISPECIES: hypothetical protein [Pseudomonas]HAB02646.1 hypothetical protein [Pseudomonas sp.]AQW68353.1 hypothetical protein B2J77_09075 [Pseudomonas parafulva]EKT4476572.1 hypothetical protein [Pseudomonas putida]ENY79642.1 hypothetical protein C206_00745 [Pseudomonas putida TRO1]KEY87801.1 hypothetical protein PC358_01420 [Pseudomonas capeferrum]
MYANPKHLHDREIKVRVDEDTFNLIQALAAYHRTQRAVLCRELLEAQLAALASENTGDQTAA